MQPITYIKGYIYYLLAKAESRWFLNVKGRLLLYHRSLGVEKVHKNDSKCAEHKSDHMYNTSDAR